MEAWGYGKGIPLADIPVWKTVTDSTWIVEDSFRSRCRHAPRDATTRRHDENKKGDNPPSIEARATVTGSTWQVKGNTEGVLAVDTEKLQKLQNMNIG